MESLSSGSINVSHLLFVDNTFIFYRANSDRLRNLLCLFLCFEAVLGLRINVAKLEFVPVGNVINVEGLASIPSGALFKAKSI